MSAQNRQQVQSGKLTPAQFTVKAIKALRKADKDGNPRLGIHTVYSGFITAFREYFGYEPGEKEDVMVKGQMKTRTVAGTDQAFEMLKELAAKGVIQMHGAKGGSMIYLPGEMPEFEDHSADKTIAAILSHKG